MSSEKLATSFLLLISSHCFKRAASCKWSNVDIPLAHPDTLFCFSIDNLVSAQEKDLKIGRYISSCLYLRTYARKLYVHWACMVHQHACRVDTIHHSASSSHKTDKDHFCNTVVATATFMQPESADRVVLCYRISFYEQQPSCFACSLRFLMFPFLHLLSYSC